MHRGTLLFTAKKACSYWQKKAGFEIKKIVYDDVDAFSIWASEQYEKDIALQDRTMSYAHNSRAGTFTEKQMHAYRKHTEKLKRKGESDQAAFYLYKP